MKKLIIYNNSLSRGGAERVTVYLAEYMVNNGVTCEVITERIMEYEYDLPTGVERKCLTAGKNYFAKLCELRRLIKQSQADVMLVMGVPNCIYASLAAIGLKIKVVVSERNDPANFLGKTVVKHVSRFLMKLADGFVFQTNDAKLYYDKKLKRRGTVIFNPLFTECLPDVYEGQRTKSIVTAGRLAAQKNQKMLISAFAKVSEKHPEYELVIYGEGPLREVLEAQVKEQGLDGKVQLPGNVSDLCEHTKDAAMFVMLSDFEGMPNALIEAMAIGLPCISTDCPCGGPRELIENRQNGILVSVGDCEATVVAINELIENSEFAKTLGENAANIRDVLDCNKIGQQWIEYLVSV